MNDQYAKESTVFSDTPPRPLPNSTAVLVLGILSIVGCCCMYGFVSLAMSVIALYLAGKDRRLYNMTPAAYTQSSYKNLNAGRTCAIIGIVLAAVIVLIYAALIAMFGYEVLSNPEAAKDAMQEFLDKYQK